MTGGRVVSLADPAATSAAIARAVTASPMPSASVPRRKGQCGPGRSTWKTAAGKVGDGRDPASWDHSRQPTPGFPARTSPQRAPDLAPVRRTV
jgi:hypothetical protein